MHATMSTPLDVAPAFRETPVPIIPRPRRDGAAESSSGDRHPVVTGQAGTRFALDGL